MFRCEGVERKPGWEDICQLPSQWDLYKKLVEGIPEDVGVLDFAIGKRWVFVEAECGCGMALSTSGGNGKFGLRKSGVYLSLRDLACQATSWNFLEASVGVAAMNAWYSNPARIEQYGMELGEGPFADAFDFYRSLCAGKKVTVIGHFPMIERLADECELSILERNPQEGDYPDPACEFILPYQDYTFMTGITLTNKTLPRLLQLLGSANGQGIMVGPSVVPSPVLFDYGVNCMAGSIVEDPERAKRSILRGATNDIFKLGVTKMHVSRPGFFDSVGA